MEEPEYNFWKNQAAEHWQKLLEVTFILGYFKGELRVKGYTTEQLDKLEKEAREYYQKFNQPASESPSAK